LETTNSIEILYGQLLRIRKKITLLKRVLAIIIILVILIILFSLFYYFYLIKMILLIAAFVFSSGLSITLTQIYLLQDRSKKIELKIYQKQKLKS
jgi:hypothetical protein